MIIYKLLYKIFTKHIYSIFLIKVLISFIDILYILSMKINKILNIYSITI